MRFKQIITHINKIVHNKIRSESEKIKENKFTLNKKKNQKQKIEIDMIKEIKV